MKKIFLTTSFLCIFHFIKAQKLPSIQLDRPDQTECPFIVPKKHFQAEIGFLHEKTNAETSSFLLPGALWKYGVNDNFELRLITEFETIKSTGSKAITGLQPIKIGFKSRLCEENGLIPKTSFIGHIALPTIAAEEFKGSFYAPSFRFTMQHSLSKNISLAYNLGTEWDGETPEPTFIYTLTTGFALTEKLGAYMELYGFAPQRDKAAHNIDGGFTYLLRNNIMIDISGGIGLTNNAPNYYTALGFSFRLKD